MLTVYVARLSIGISRGCALCGQRTVAPRVDESGFDTRPVGIHTLNMIPDKLKVGDTVAVIAPSRSLGIISAECRDIADKRFKDMVLNLKFSEHSSDMDEFGSSPVSSRIEDLHNAFKDPSVKGIFAVIGGFNANQLLQYIDWGLIEANPKIFCGFSDTTVLQNAIYAKTGLVTYSAPAYSTFGQKLYFDYTLDYFKKCCMESAPYSVKPSVSWSDDQWYKDQDKRHLMDNSGWTVINEGEAEGTILGGNLCTFNLLQGTEYFPNMRNSVLFIEDDHVADIDLYEFDRNLQSLIQQPSFSGVLGIAIGRFQTGSNMHFRLLKEIIDTKKELAGIPVIANVDFGHTDPKISFPIGGTVKMSAKRSDSELEIVSH